MKVLNIVLSVLILLLAIASAVFAYFLYEKREQMTNGWAMMARAINSTSKTLDNDSGTTVSSGLTESELSHQNYAGLQAKLNQLNKQVADYAQSRTNLANSLIAAANAAGVNVNIPNTELMNAADLSAANQKQTELITGIKEIKARIDATTDRIRSIAGKLGLPNADFASAATYADALNKLDARADAYNTQLNNMRTQIANIAKALNAPLSQAVNESNYSEMLKQVLAASEKTTKELAEANQRINDPTGGLLRQIANLKEEVTQRDQTITEKNTVIEQKNGEIRRLIAVIDPQSDANTQPDIWQPGSLASRKALQGRVLEVNDKYGIITVDLGKNTRVYQQIGQNRVEVDPEVPADVTMAVIRERGDRTEYIGRIKLVRINDNCSIAESVKEEGGTDRSVRVGDIVFFTDIDLASLPQN